MRTVATVSSPPLVIPYTRSGEVYEDSLSACRPGVSSVALAAPLP